MTCFDRNTGNPARMLHADVVKRGFSNLHEFKKMNLQGLNCLRKANFSPHVPGLLGKPLSSNFSIKAQTKRRLVGRV